MTLAWRITGAYVLLILATTALLGVYLPTTRRASALGQLETSLAIEARLLADAALPVVLSHDAIDAQTLATRLSGSTGARFTIMTADGVVLGDSDPLGTVASQAGRPEIAPVLAGAPSGVSPREAPAGEGAFVYVAVPIRNNDQLVGVARVGRDRTEIDRDFWGSVLAVLIDLTIAGLLAALLAWRLARRLSRPLGRLTAGARAFARGDMRRVPTTDDHGELDELGRAFDEMAERLRDTIETLERDHARLAALLSAMEDGVILLDRDSRVILANEAALRLLEFVNDSSNPRPLIELVHDHELHEVAQQTLAGHRGSADLLRFATSGNHLHVTGTPMSGPGRGALIMVQDVTDIRRAETIRRDFVANVSHELKTPIASIKALTESLESGAVEDLAVAYDFLQRMHVEVDGLAQLVQELLDLSRIESGRTRLVFEPVIPEVLASSAVERLSAQAERAGVALMINVPFDLPPVRADATRVEGALINLIHNAIKFTPPNGEIVVSGESVGPDLVRFLVSDTGIGVPPEEVDRLFERFYKADRSRATSGTGLGLAIVKHVVQAHGGQVGVRSTVGEGSTFWFTLPVATPATLPGRAAVKVSW